MDLGLGARNSCGRLGCTHPRDGLKLLDYGVRGVLPLAADRVELSIGIGGGHIWYSRESGDSYFNDALLQYSGKATVALDSSKRFRIGLTIRAWRDVGRPSQQWLSTGAIVSYGFGGRR